MGVFVIYCFYFDAHVYSNWIKFLRQQKVKPTINYAKCVRNCILFVHYLQLPQLLHARDNLVFYLNGFNSRKLQLIRKELAVLCVCMWKCISASHSNHNKSYVNEWRFSDYMQTVQILFVNCAWKISIPSVFLW